MNFYDQMANDVTLQEAAAEVDAMLWSGQPHVERQLTGATRVSVQHAGRCLAAGRDMTCVEEVKNAASQKI